MLCWCVLHLHWLLEACIYVLWFVLCSCARGADLLPKIQYMHTWCTKSPSLLVQRYRDHWDDYHVSQSTFFMEEMQLVLFIMNFLTRLDKKLMSYAGSMFRMSCEVLGKLHSLKHNLKPPWTWCDVFINNWIARPKQPEVFRAMRQKILNSRIEMAWTKLNIIHASSATAGYSSENLALTQK